MTYQDKIIANMLRVGQPQLASDIAHAVECRTDIHDILRRMEAKGIIKIFGKLGKAYVWGMEGMNPVPKLPAYRKCPVCGETKPWTLEFFHRDNRAISGLKGHCKLCNKTAAYQKPKVEEDEPEETKVEVTQGGRRIRFGKDWKPYREPGKKLPAMFGYASPLA